MEMIDIFKTLGNEYCLQMLQWLKEPEKHFDAECICSESNEFAGGVCVGKIVEKTGLAPSVVSNYLNALYDTGLVESRRIGKWTYYRYNHQAVASLLHQLHQQL